MPIKFNPTGFLDINTEASDLPSERREKVEGSGAMRRCTNLVLDQDGIAKTRYGSTKINETPYADTCDLLIEHEGARYEFCGDTIYRNETSLVTGLTDARWSALRYQPYNATAENIFAMNGTDMVRIDGTTVAGWGADAPDNAPEALNHVDAIYTYDWEKTSNLIVETQLDACDSVTGWTDSPDARGTLSVETLYKIEGAGCVEIHFATGTAASTYYIQKQFTAQDWSGYDKISFWFRRNDYYPGASHTCAFSFGESAGDEQVFYFTPPANYVWAKITIDISSVAAAAGMR